MLANYAQGHKNLQAQFEKTANRVFSPSPWDSEYWMLDDVGCSPRCPQVMW